MLASRSRPRMRSGLTRGTYPAAPGPTLGVGLLVEHLPQPPELVAEATRQLVHHPGQRSEVDAEAIEDAALAAVVGVDLGRELLVGRLRLVVLATIAQEVQDEVLVELHGLGVPLHGAARNGRLRSLPAATRRRKGLAWRI